MGALSRHGVFALMLGAIASCLDDTVEVPAPEPGRPYCMIAGSAFGYFADGSRKRILWPTRSPAGCACLMRF
jgi:hypothetical protein